MRSKAREYAVQILYSLDLNPVPVQEQIKIFWEMHPCRNEVEQYANWLVEGTIELKDEIDRLISQHSSNWKVDRMPVTDRNILRLATFEFLKDRSVPPKVVMDEAIELARKFGSGDSASFVNGVLDGIHHRLQQNAAEGVPEA